MLYSIFTRIAIGSSYTVGQILYDIARYGLGKVLIIDSEVLKKN
jgi:hypothetical protein